MRLVERWRNLVRLLATMASTEVGTEIAVGNMLVPFWRHGWKMAPPTERT